MSDFKYEIKDLETMRGANNYHEWVLSELKEFLGADIAEVGAGSGTFSAFLLKHPGLKKLTSIEPDRTACSLYQKNISDERAGVVNGFFGNISQNYPNAFDSVVYVNVLEHVEDDKGELTRVYKSLKDEGRVCIFVPALPFLYI